MASQDQQTEEIVEEILSGKRRLQGRLTRMQKELKAWDEIGGLPRAIRKVEIVRDGLAEYRKHLDAALPRLEGAIEKHRRQRQEDLYHALESYALESDLTFEGTLGQDTTEPVKLAVGPYRILLEPGEPAQVRFVKTTVGEISSADPDQVAERMAEIRDGVESETEEFLPRLKSAYQSVAGTQGGKAPLGRILKYFIADLQPESFWGQADVESLRPYGHVNFAWELLRESEAEAPPFKVTEASVRANVSAAGRRGERGDALFLKLHGQSKPRLYSHLRWTGSPEGS